MPHVADDRTADDQAAEGQAAEVQAARDRGAGKRPASVGLAAALGALAGLALSAAWGSWAAVAGADFHDDVPVIARVFGNEQAFDLLLKSLNLRIKL